MESMCWTSSTVVEQEGDSRQKPSVFFDQLLHKSSERTVAIDILEGDEPAVVQRAWGLLKDIKSGLKNNNEVSGAASMRRFCSQ